jgi:hypothetical protein
MNKPITFLIFLFISYSAIGQKYDPAKVTNWEAYSSDTTPKRRYGMDDYLIDARTYFYIVDSFKYRPYASQYEVLGYLDLPKYRVGDFEILIAEGKDTSIWRFLGGIDNRHLVKLPDSLQRYNKVKTK